MATDWLLWILLVITIIAAIFLVMVLYRAYNVLGDTKDVSGIASKRVKELDERISKAENRLDSFSEGVKGFIYSLDFIKMLRDKLMKESKGGKDGKE